MGRRVAGTCYIKLDGEQFDIEGGIEVPLSDLKRETKMNLATVSGYTETAARPYIKLTAVLTPDFPIDFVRENTEMTITAELANGMVYTLSGAWLEGDTVAKPVDGNVDLEFAGMRGQWQ